VTEFRYLIFSLCLLAGSCAPAQAQTSDPVPAPATVRLASLEWEPYIGPNLTEQGYAAALVRAALATQGVSVEIEYLPWARALHDARRGAFDGIFPEYFDSTRETEFVFSDPFPGGPVGLYKRKTDPIAFAVNPAIDMEGALRSIAQWRIGVVRDYLNTPVFDAADYLRRQAAVDDAANLRKLIYGRVDLIFIDFHVARHLLGKQMASRASQLEPLLPALENKSLYIAFSRNAGRHEALRLAFNAGLAEITRSGLLQKIRLAHGFDANR